MRSPLWVYLWDSKFRTIFSSALRPCNVHSQVVNDEDYWSMLAFFGNSLVTSKNVPV